MSAKTKRIAWRSYLVLLHVLATLGIIFIGLIIYWYPVIDRLANWCEYYPQSVSNCREEQ